MSRSRKAPYYTQQQNTNTRQVKRRANRAIRDINEDEAPANGKAYRKEFSSWNINDWSFHTPKDKKAFRK